ncbi:hypothetical protein [Dyadobacter sp. NIV53]|uniref:hypothetical protein n=1 Tax=Dyadobacter sp. NIV53 TaxID=2861765 RepID=UPI001C883096|nr:hypothetical protein [Dyadobacter sp. NIV53]
MYILNPLGNPDALWQHAVMIVVSAMLGFMIGYVTCKRAANKLEMKLAKLDSELQSCNLRRAQKNQNVPFTKNEPISKI